MATRPGGVIVQRKSLAKRERNGRRARTVDDQPRARPTPERLRRAGDELERGDSGQITMRDAPLERVLARGVISQEQYWAASKYRHHWYHAGLSDRLESADLNRVFASDVSNFSGMAKSEAQAFHRARYREAVQCAGKIGSHVLDWIVCREVEPGHVGFTLGWGNRAQAHAAAIERLKEALEALRRLWGIGNR